MITILKKLINADSTIDKGEFTVASLIAQEFKKSGIPCSIDRWDKTRANVIARIKARNPRKNALLFLSHLDVVPPGKAKWKTPPFSAKQIGSRLYGRGSVDMKGGIVSSLAAITYIAKSKIKLAGDIIFVASAGEETDSCGVTRFIRNYKPMPELTGVIVPEPTNFDVITSHRGLLWLKITTIGKTAHGSTPHLGINAISSMKAILDELQNYKIPFKPHKLLGSPSMSINTITGGKAVNVIPDSCDIGIDIRTLPSQNHNDIIACFNKILAKLRRKIPNFNANISIIRDAHPLETDPKSPFVKQCCTLAGKQVPISVGFCTDGSYMSDFAPVVILGPGDWKGCHKPDEFIDINDLEKAANLYKNLILHFLT